MDLIVTIPHGGFRIQIRTSAVHQPALPTTKVLFSSDEQFSDLKNPDTRLLRVVKVLEFTSIPLIGDVNEMF